ncbi:hypothetical protein GCM10009801_23820 [Streptomyces albiaxialis]|uniref:Membrane protein YndG n=1 Tax=Streptomyces albiaxialis TaxID=329523 RepID=A0ABN2VTA7_9ACTN
MGAEGAHAPKGLYVEARVRTDLDELWRRTQDPEQHQRWDLRFTRIAYLDGDGGDGGPRRFTYGVRVLPGLTVSGTGVSAGERHRPDGTRTSALRFASPHPLSFIEEGSGYWRYVPCGDGTVRFLTGYGYVPRWGRAGALADRYALRPLMGWATAWSFDRLRLWCERGVTPERALVRALSEAVARLLAVAGAAYGAYGAHGAPSVPSVPSVAAAALVALAAVLLPPLPGTPAARRCLRRAPTGARTRAARTPRAPGTAAHESRTEPTAPTVPTTPPALLDRLERP